jgi:hypothetical protein
LGFAEAGVAVGRCRGWVSEWHGYGCGVFGVGGGKKLKLNIDLLVFCTLPESKAIQNKRFLSLEGGRYSLHFTSRRTSALQSLLRHHTSITALLF